MCAPLWPDYESRVVRRREAAGCLARGNLMDLTLTAAAEARLRELLEHGTQSARIRVHVTASGCG